MAATIPQMREALHQAKADFDREVFEGASLSKAQKLHLWNEFLATVKPLSRRLAEAERQESRLYLRNLLEPGTARQAARAGMN